MVPAAYNIDGLITIDRTNQELYIDINGTKQALHYNNKFINPKELYEKEITAKKIINHLKESLIILEQNQKISNTHEKQI